MRPGEFYDLICKMSPKASLELERLAIFPEENADLLQLSAKLKHFHELPRLVRICSEKRLCPEVEHDLRPPVPSEIVVRTIKFFRRA